MTEHLTDHKPIVVGVDGSPESLDALRWAASWAHRSELPLRLLTSTRPSIPDAVSEAGYVDPIEQAELLLDGLANSVAAQFPDQRVEVQVEVERPADALTEASRTAHAVVIGSRGRGVGAELLLGSTSADLSASSRCPLVVVPPGQADWNGTGEVVVGVDGSPESLEAAAFAVDFAGVARAELVAACATEPPLPATGSPVGTMPVRLVDEDSMAEAERVVDRSLHPLLADSADLPVRTVTVPGPAGPALTDLARDASLLVVGSRGRGGLAGLLLGSTSRTVLRTATCPVAIVRAA